MIIGLTILTSQNLCYSYIGRYDFLTIKCDELMLTECSTMRPIDVSVANVGSRLTYSRSTPSHFILRPPIRSHIRLSNSAWRHQYNISIKMSKVLLCSHHHHHHHHVLEKMKTRRDTFTHHKYHISQLYHIVITQWKIERNSNSCTSLRMRGF